MGVFVSAQDHPVIKVWCNVTILKVSLPPRSVPGGFHWHPSGAGLGSVTGRGAAVCLVCSAGLRGCGARRDHGWKCRGGHDDLGKISASPA